MDLTSVIEILSQGLANFTWQNAVMIVVGGVLIVLAIAKEYEPMLLLPIGIGCIFANVGMSAYEENFLGILYKAGIETELFPLLIFIGVGAMIDFRPLLAMPSMAMLGAAGHFGIYATLILAALLGFELNESAAIAAIGTIDGPTAIFVTSRLAPEMLGPIAVAAYSYMSLVPIIQPPIMKALTTRKERLIRMEYAQRHISDRAMIMFPIIVAVLVAVIAPDAAPLIASLMLGNLLRESGVVERLSKSAQNEIINIATLFLGLTIGATMTGETFIRVDTLYILILGLFAFVLDSVGGLLFGKVLAAVTKGKINPLVGACGISAFPMSGRLSAQVALQEDPDNFILMHAIGSNTAGQLASVVAGSLLFALVVGLL
jgi:oxaloacetate decarboxylase beta subunit